MLLRALAEVIRAKVEGSVVEACRSAREALDKIQADDYAVVVSDLLMGGMHGLELLDCIRVARPATMVLLITGGRGPRSQHLEALRGGAIRLHPEARRRRLPGRQHRPRPGDAAAPRRGRGAAGDAPPPRRRAGADGRPPHRRAPPGPAAQRTSSSPPSPTSCRTPAHLDPGLGAAPPQREARRRGDGAGHRVHRPERAGPGAAHRRPARRFADHHREDGALDPPRRPRAHRGDRAGGRLARGAGEGDLPLAPRRGGRGPRARGSPPPPAGLLEPPLQPP